MLAYEIWADEIVSPSSKGGVTRYRPGKLNISNNGTILSIESVSQSKLSLLKKSSKRLRSKIILPGLVDCHTHLVFAGNRSDEWGRRLKGATYQEIAKSGGGIRKTMEKTREAGFQELVQSASKRIREIISFGVTTVEIKSGYGLDLESELKILKVIASLKKKFPLQIISTFMGAHSLPPEFKSHSEYIKFIETTMLPAVKGLAEFQDVFCEDGYFSQKDSIHLLEAGKKFGLKPKIHAHEFGRTGGVSAAGQVHAISADHLMAVNDEDLKILKSAAVIPVILPGTSFFLGAKSFAPAREFLNAGLKLAIGSDFNPGTNPTLNFPLCGTMAAIHQNLSLDEVLMAQTYHSALALDKRDRGVLEPGKRADFITLDAECFEEFYYSYGSTKVESVYCGGKKIY